MEASSWSTARTVVPIRSFMVATWRGGSSGAGAEDGYPHHLTVT